MLFWFVSCTSKRGISWLRRVRLYSEWDGSKLLLTCKEEKCYQLWPWRLTQKDQQKLKLQVYRQNIFCSRGKYVLFFIHQPHCPIILLSWSLLSYSLDSSAFHFLPFFRLKANVNISHLTHFHVAQNYFVINHPEQQIQKLIKIVTCQFHQHNPKTLLAKPL
jgi:hypothetical protein